MTAEEKAKKEEPKEEKAEKKEQPKGEKKEAKEEAKAKEQPKKKAAAEEVAPAEPEERKHPRCKVTRMTLEQVEKQLATTQEKMGGLSSHFAKSLLDRRAALLDEQQTAGTQRKAA